MIEIRRWDNGAVIHSGDFKDVKECLESGVELGIDFSFANLNGAKLNDAKLNYAKLNGAQLNGAKLNDAKLNYAKLNGAQLNGAKLNGAELNGAELNGAELNGAELNDAELNDAKLNYAKLNGAQLNGAKLNGAKLNYAKLPEKSWCMPAGEEYYLFISSQVVQVGCKSFTPKQWRAFSKDDIAKMDGKRALKFYPRLIELLDFYLPEVATENA